MQREGTSQGAGYQPPGAAGARWFADGSGLPYAL